jgi:predicted TPR repeat methyltransferase
LNNSQTNLAIQQDRIWAIKNALNQRKYKTVLDFGIGVGVKFKDLQLIYEKTTGFCLSKHMIELYEKILKSTRSFKQMT